MKKRKRWGEEREMGRRKELKREGKKMRKRLVTSPPT